MAEDAEKIDDTHVHIEEEALTIEEALALLERHHITRDICDATFLMLNHEDGICEHIGEIWAVSKGIYLAEYIPSYLDMTYPQVQKSLTLLDSQRANFRLKSILDGLPNTAKRYDDAQRYEKIQKIRQYFRKRKNAVNYWNDSILKEIC